MPFLRLRTAVVCAVLCLLPSLALAAAPKADATENPPTLSAASLLPEAVLVGPNHSVDDKVVNDGYLNIYTLHSPKGDLHVESTALLYTRIQELAAAAAMNQVNVGAEMGKSVAKSAAGAVTGAFNLIVHPADSLSSVGKSFSRAQASAQSDRPKDDDGTVGERLKAMGATKDQAELFIDNPHFDPITQTRLVLALDRMTNVGGRPDFIKFSILTDNEDLAFFRTRMAELYANLNATTDPIVRFTNAGRFIVAETPGNGFLAAFPLDYLAWTPTLASIAQTLDNAAKAQGAKTKKLVVAGEVSPLSAKNLKKAGWTVVQLREGLRGK